MGRVVIRDQLVQLNRETLTIRLNEGRNEDVRTKNLPPSYSLISSPVINEQTYKYDVCFVFTIKYQKFNNI